MKTHKMKNLLAVLTLSVILIFNSTVSTCSCTYYNNELNSYNLSANNYKSYSFDSLDSNIKNYSSDSLNNNVKYYSFDSLDNNVKYYSSDSLDSNAKYYSFDSLNHYDNYEITEDLRNKIYNELLIASSVIDVSAYKLTLFELTDIISDIVNKSPELFYVTNQFTYTGNDYIETFSPKYDAEGETLENHIKTYEAELDKICALVNPSWSDLEKVVFVHDYIEQNFEFDLNGEIYDCYGFLTQKRGVCQAYALTFYAIMTRMGVDTSFAISTSMDHMWNVVKIDGNWYHVDTTWDDPYYDYFGYAFHNFLLLSDEAIQTDTTFGENHHDWSCPYECTDTTYDNYFWKEQNVVTPFKYLDGKWYYGCYDNDLNEAAIFSTNLNNSHTPVYALDNWTNDDASEIYKNCYSGLNVYNNELIFNSSSEIFAYEPMTDTVTPILKKEAAKNFYSTRVNDSKLTYLYAEAPDDIGTLFQTNLPKAAFSDKEAFMADVDFDGKVTLTDAALALKGALLISPLSQIQTLSADIDNDGKVQLTDVVMILRKALLIE